MSETEIEGVAIHRRDDPSGPVWGWRTEERYGITMHHEIQWRREDYRWMRGAAITDTKEEGGWQRYAVHYAKAYDEDEAWDIVQRTIERELTSKPDMP